MLSSAPVSYFGSNFLLKIPIDSRLLFFERKFNSIQRLQKKRKPNFNVLQAKNVIPVAVENSNVFLGIFLFLKFFIECICFSIQLIFQKFSSEAMGRDKPIR